MKDDIGGCNGENQRLLPKGLPSEGATPTHSKATAWSARRRFLSGLLLPLLLAVGLFAVSMGFGRHISLKGNGGGPPAPDSFDREELGVGIPTSVEYPEVESRTKLCVTPSKPMLGGVDLVAYRDLEEGEAPI